MRMHEDRMIVLQVFLEPLFLIVLQRKCRGQCILVNKRQLEWLGTRHPPRGKSWQRPGQINHAILDLIQQLRRLAAQLHRPITLNFEPAFGCSLDFFRPGNQERLWRIRNRRNEGLQFKRDRLRLRGTHKDPCTEQHCANSRSRFRN